MADKIPDIFFRMDNAPIMFRNFAGKKTQFNMEGARNFCIDLSGEDTDQLIRDGWNVKWLKPKEEDDEPRPFLKVAVSYNFKPPRVVLVNSKGQTNLTQDMLEILDFAELTNVDLIVRGWHWGPNPAGKEGIKAELKTGFFTIFEDELELKYSLLDGATSILEGTDD
jgi:hypothetical protein